MFHALSFVVSLLAFSLPLAYAATADQWRGRSIYQCVAGVFTSPNCQIDSSRCPPVESSSTDMLCLKELILLNALQATVRGVVVPGTRMYR